MNVHTPLRAWRHLCGLAPTVGIVLLCACGGRSAVVAEPDFEIEVEPRPCCVTDRWESPPPRIGETPPDYPAPADALDEFEPQPPPPSELRPSSVP